MDRLRSKVNFDTGNAFFIEWSTINKKKVDVKKCLYNFICGEVRAFLTMLDLT